MSFKESGQMTGTESGYSTMSYTWVYRKQAWSGYGKIQDPSSAGLQSAMKCIQLFLPSLKKIKNTQTWNLISTHSLVTNDSDINSGCKETIC